MQLLHNPNLTRNLPDPAPEGAAGFTRPIDFHRAISGYEPSASVSVPGLARQLGVGRILVKYELERFGLPAFKIIGASWATYRLLTERFAARDGHPPTATTFDGLRAELGGDQTAGEPVTLVTATDGNHGRAVARAVPCRFGLAADIYMPAGTAAARVSGIESEGRRATVIPGDYDQAVALVASTASPDRLVVSDTSWPGYEQIPLWISDGDRRSSPSSTGSWPSPATQRGRCVRRAGRRGRPGESGARSRACPGYPTVRCGSPSSPRRPTASTDHSWPASR